MILGWTGHIWLLFSFFCPACLSPRLQLPVITRKTSFFAKGGICCHQFCLIQSYTSLIKSHILSLGSILTMKYRLKYLCVSIGQREQRRCLYLNCITVDRFVPPPSGIDWVWGGSCIASATVWLCCSISGVGEHHPLPWSSWVYTTCVSYLENVRFKRQQKELEAELTNWQGEMIGRKQHIPCASEKPVLFVCPFILQKPLNTLGDSAGRSPHGIRTSSMERSVWHSRALAGQRFCMSGFLKLSLSSSLSNKTQRQPSLLRHDRRGNGIFS